MTTRGKVFLGLGLYVAADRRVRGRSSAGRATTTTPSSPRTSSSSTRGSSSARSTVNKAVLYVFARGDPHVRHDDLRRAAHAAAPQPRADRGRDGLHADARQHHARATWTTRWRRKWFPFIGALFLFIWFSNMIGYLPLPTNTQHKVDIFGLEVPSLRALRRDGEPLGPARAGPGRLVRLPRRGHPHEGPRSATSRA